MENKMKICNFEDFCTSLLDCGFSMGGENAKGVFAVIPFSWNNQLAYSPIRWHTGDPETDPWEWRMRVLEERTEIAYAKLFFKTSGYITKEWYPCFLAVRRKGMDFEEAYRSGTVSHIEKQIYDIVAEKGEAALHEIKQIGGFTKEDASRFDRAVVELQMRMELTLCGRAQKINKQGEGYGWNSTVFCTAEEFWNRRGTDIIALSGRLSAEEAYQKIEDRIRALNPNADKKTICKFIKG